jgi:hypothetical protein
MGDFNASMMRGALTLSTFVSIVFFPWPLSALLALAASFFEPLVPLAAGIFFDTLYYAPSAHGLPLFTVCGAVVTAIAFLVRSQLSADSRREF